MSTKLDAIAYRNSSDYRLRRLEKVVLTLEQIERGCHIFPDKKQEYFDLLKEMSSEQINSVSKNTNGE